MTKILSASWWQKSHESKGETITLLKKRSELKTIKQGTWSISEYVFHFEEIGDVLLSRGDHITKQDQINAILEGLPKEYIK